MSALLERTDPAAFDDIVASLTRRGLVGGAIGTAALAGLSACGSDSGSDKTAATGAGFPVRVAHRFGSTVVPSPPKRVVSAGSCTQDFILALGVVPVGITDWYGDQPDATWPWAHGRLDGQHPTVLSADDGFDFERIATLRPDLIVATNDGMTSSDYKKLSALAPTIPQSGKYRDYYSPWTVQLADIGAALGRSSEAKAVADGISDRFARARTAHPELAGGKAVLLQNAVSGGDVIAYQSGLGTEFLTELGLVVPSEIARFAKDAQAYIPVEQLSVLDAADVLIWATEKDSDEAALHKVPGFDRLSAVRAGRSIYTGGVLSGAIYFDSPLSLPYIVDRLAPQLATALA